MNIRSNIAAVIRQTEKLIAHIPVAMNAALSPDVWREDAMAVAERILKAIAQPEEASRIPAFLATLDVTGLHGGGLSLKMSAPSAAGRSIIEDARAAKQSINAKDKGMGLFDLTLQDFEDLILRWVQTPKEEGGKDKDRRDWGKSDEEIAHLISYIMLTPDPGPKAKEARRGLTPHIAAFLAGQQGGGLSPTTADMWLRAVLAGWREAVRLLYPRKVWVAMRE